MPFQQMLNKLNPRLLFLIDSLGAAVSAGFLGLFLVKFASTFGMPQKLLYPLAFLACFFSGYSFLCFLIKPKKWPLFMKCIAVANLIYCCLTIGLIVLHYQKLTVLGLIYFGLEILLVTLLALIELKAAATLNF